MVSRLRSGRQNSPENSAFPDPLRRVAVGIPPPSEWQLVPDLKLNIIFSASQVGSNPVNPWQKSARSIIALGESDHATCFGTATSPWLQREE